MKKLLVILILVLLFSGNAYSFDYGYDIWQNYSGGILPEEIGGGIIVLLILYTAFFGETKTKFAIWSWIFFFGTFGFVLSLFDNGGFLEAMISLGAGLAACCFIIYLGDLWEKKEYSDWAKSKKKLKKNNKI